MTRAIALLLHVSITRSVEISSTSYALQADEHHDGTRRASGESTLHLQKSGLVRREIQNVDSAAIRPRTSEEAIEPKALLHQNEATPASYHYAVVGWNTKSWRVAYDAAEWGGDQSQCTSDESTLVSGGPGRMVISCCSVHGQGVLRDCSHVYGPFSDAKVQCESAGNRLCTQAEVLNGQTTGMKCSVDGSGTEVWPALNLVWTSTPCTAIANVALPDFLEEDVDAQAHDVKKPRSKARPAARRRREGHGFDDETVMSIFLSVVGSVVVTSLWAWWSLRDSGSDDSAAAAQEERSCLLDNAKVFVQILVIWGHFMFDGRTESIDYLTTGGIHARTWLHGSGALTIQLRSGLKPFRMPLACILSGVCSQGTVSPKKIRRFVQNLVLPTFLWIFAVKPVVHTFLKRFHLKDLEVQLHNLATFQAFEAEWYLEALIFWRASVFLLWSHVRSEVAFAGMLTVSCVMGYHDFGVGPSHIFMLNTVAGFLPYFAVGYVLPFQAVARRMPAWNAITAIGISFAVLIWCFVLVPMLFPDPLPEAHCAFGKCTDVAIMRGLPPRDLSLYWCRRLARVAVEVPPALLVLFFVIPSAQTPLSWAGKYTLYPFLFHDLAHSWEDWLLTTFPAPELTSQTAHLAIYLVHLGLAICYVAFFASSYWRFMFQWCLDPTWLYGLLANKTPSIHYVKDQGRLEKSAVGVGRAVKNIETQ